MKIIVTITLKKIDCCISSQNAKDETDETDMDIRRTDRRRRSFYIPQFKIRIKHDHRQNKNKSLE